MASTQDPTFRAALRILRSYGEVVKANLAEFKLTYNDDKIYIEAYPYINGETPDHVLIQLKFPAKDDKQSPNGNRHTPFGLPRRTASNTIGTPVYLWLNDSVHYLRAGRWLHYMDKLTREIDEYSHQTRKFDRQRILDSELFPDLPDFIE